MPRNTYAGPPAVAAASPSNDPVLAVLSIACGLTVEPTPPGRTAVAPATVQNDAALAVLSEACQPRAPRGRGVIRRIRVAAGQPLLRQSVSTS